jgi:dihydrolipoyl dehydrogenase
MVMGSLVEETEVVVIGAGPGGYVAAIRAADLGKEVVLVEQREQLGGVCLLEGCIPSKTLIHAVELLHQSREAERIGLSFGTPKVDTQRLVAWKNEVVEGLSGGVTTLLEKRGVEVIQARARFDSPSTLALDGGDVAGIRFRHAIIATGSSPRPLGITGGDLDGIWTSDDALALREIPGRLLVVGGGYIGMELGLVYAGLGSQVTVAEFQKRLLAGADADLVRVMAKQAERRLTRIFYEAKVTEITRDVDHWTTTLEQGGERQLIETDAVLACVGRAPNSEGLGLDQAGVAVNPRGFIETDDRCRTSAANIYAIGDVTPGPMLAHKASREAHVAAEVIADQPSAFDNRAVPAVVFTDPEIAWTGLTETEARAQDRTVNIGKFPLTALGRARTLGRTDGLVKVLSEPESNLVLGVGIVGVSASELIAEATLAVEMGATLEDLMVTTHPHPTLSESLMEAAEVAAGAAVHIVPPRKK